MVSFTLNGTIIYKMNTVLCGREELELEIETISFQRKLLGLYIKWEGWSSVWLNPTCTVLLPRILSWPQIDICSFDWLAVVKKAGIWATLTVTWKETKRRERWAANSREPFYWKHYKDNEWRLWFHFCPHLFVYLNQLKWAKSSARQAAEQEDWTDRLCPFVVV